MLVEGEPLDLLVEFLELVAEPVWKAVVDLADLLSHFVPAGGRAAATRLMWNDQGDALVERAGQKGRFPEARMTDDGDAGRVEVSVGHQVIHGAMQAISPRGDRS